MKTAFFQRIILNFFIGITTLLAANEVRAQFVKGADIGWLQQMEATGYKFYDSTGNQKECLLSLIHI